VPFCGLALLVARKWPPLQSADASFEAVVHRLALSDPWLVELARALTFLGNTSTRIVVTAIVVAALLARRAWRLAMYLGGTAWLGSGLSTLIKTVVERTRPALPEPIATAGGASFPSGHAMGAMVLYGALLLVILPALRPVTRRWAWATTVLLILGVGASRVVLGVHYLSDVVGAWILGLAWLAISTAVFNLFRTETGQRSLRSALEGVEPEEAARLR